ncbi:hypothetical protein B0A49_06084 [Cryomyces minteri]|uniref:Uncharacterized protein n=1 Tax=Cryomyces minteri TaxID=331657 RepID=A0A4U0X1G2_9PEZI|nr:hypothetical protein B0A49_06508 [Cryomyces minteri]TKA70613.1 hypothetical protein B0A49_06084 [Cryomyces minteri]
MHGERLTNAGSRAPSALSTRFNNASKSPLGILSDGDDDDDAPSFLPFANLPKQTVQDSSATLRTDSKASDKQSAHRPHPSKAPPVRNPQQVESSASSASSNPQGQRQRPPGALSPHHRAELAKLSPRHRKEGSDGTPSMGSSFSDLDDASVTQSALEEALLSNMQHGGVASRMSTISQALKSRYLP